MANISRTELKLEEKIKSKYISPEERIRYYKRFFYSLFGALIIIILIIAIWSLFIYITHKPTVFTKTYHKIESANVKNGAVIDTKDNESVILTYNNGDEYSFEVGNYWSIGKELSIPIDVENGTDRPMLFLDVDVYTQDGKKLEPIDTDKKDDLTNTKLAPNDMTHGYLYFHYTPKENETLIVKFKKEVWGINVTYRCHDADKYGE